MKKLRFICCLMVVVLLFNLSVPCFATDETEETTALPSINPSITAPFFDDTPLVSEGEDNPAPTGFELQPPLAEYNYPIIYSINAKAAVLVELNSHSILYAYELDTQVYPASLTKIMTCMLALEHGNLEDLVTVTSSAFTGIDAYSSSAGLVEGERLPLREMLYGVMVSSANEACNAVAEYISGDIDTFVALMNQKAMELGMTGTHFANPHGLHEDDHYTTARDLATLAAWAWQNPQFREFATTVEHTLPATDFSPARTLQTTNMLTLDSEDNRYYYPKARGIKTGFTTPAGTCLISTASEGDLSFMSVVLGCSSYYYDDGTEIDMRFPQSEELLEYGFEHYSFRQVLSDQVILDQPAVSNAGGQQTVAVHAKCDASVPLPLTANAKDITMKFNYNGSLQAPLAAGQKVGTVTVYYTNIPIAQTDLMTLTEVATPQAVTGEHRNTSAPYQIAPKTESSSGGALRYWFFLLPIVLLAVVILILLLIRQSNIRKAKRRAARRRSQHRPMQ